MPGRGILMMTNEKKENTVYYVANTHQFTGDAETAIALAAKDIKKCNERSWVRETISEPIAFKTRNGYIVKCIRENGKDFKRKIFVFDSSKDKIPFEGIILNAQKN